MAPCRAGRLRSKSCPWAAFVMTSALLTSAGSPRSGGAWPMTRLPPRRAPTFASARDPGGGTRLRSSPWAPRPGAWLLLATAFDPSRTTPAKPGGSDRRAPRRSPGRSGRGSVHAPRTAGTAPMPIRREVSLLDGRGRHGRVSTTDDSRAGSEASEDGPADLDGSAAHRVRSAGSRPACCGLTVARARAAVRKA